MPNVTATPVGLSTGEVKTLFIDTTSTTNVTYTYPLQHDFFSIENQGREDIIVTIGSHLNRVVKPRERFETKTMFTSFMVRSTIHSQAFQAAAHRKAPEAMKENVYESITVSVADMGTIAANTIKQISKTLSTLTINTTKYHVNIVPTSIIPNTLCWSYGINSGSNAVHINLSNPQITAVTPASALTFEVMLVEK